MKIRKTDSRRSERSATARLFLAVGAFAVLAGGCLPHPVYGKLDGNYETSGLTSDLRAAAPAYARDSRANGYEVVWVGSRAEDYAIARGPTGAPVKKVAQITVLARHSATQKCFGQDGSLVRANEGGAVYGKPVIDAFLAVNGTPADYPGNGGFEFACHGLDEVKGGVRIDGSAGISTP
jgi:hypothetical protein